MIQEQIISKEKFDELKNARYKAVFASDFEEKYKLIEQVIEKTDPMSVVGILQENLGDGKILVKFERI